MNIVHVAPRHQLEQHPLDLDGVGLAREAEAAHDAPHVRVDGDALVAAEGVAEHDGRGLPPHPGHLHELLERARHLAAVALGDHLARAAQRAGLLVVVAGRVDRLRELGLVGDGERLGARVARRTAPASPG